MAARANLHRRTSAGPRCCVGAPESTRRVSALRWLGGRLFSILHTYRPYERKVLLHLAALRAIVTAGAALLFWSATIRQGWPVALGLTTTACVAVWASLVCADFVEHSLRRWLLGYSYNPFVSAIGEWELWMGPTDPDDALGIAAWHKAKRGRQPHECPWWGDVASFYPTPAA